MQKAASKLDHHHNWAFITAGGFSSVSVQTFIRDICQGCAMGAWTQTEEGDLTGPAGCVGDRPQKPQYVLLFVHRK